jgi:UDP-N-acetylmuramoylalanine--D-glutamate ligase
MIQKLCELLKDKKILILGFGREGKSTYQFLRKHFPGKQLGIYDKNGVKDTLPYVDVFEGDSYQDILHDYDLVMKSPGIVLNITEPELLSRFTSQTDLFLRFFREQTIGITGTKGKSTTSSLLYHILKHASKDAILVGNIGIPVFDTLENIKEETLVVFELSSHQLEYVAHSPRYSVLLNIFQEHLDHYGTFEKYKLAKENIYQFQHKGDVLLYNPEFYQLPENFEAETITITNNNESADVVVNDNQIIIGEEILTIEENETNLLGKHNIYNIAVSYAMARLFGVTKDIFMEAVQSFQPLPHRMEYVTELNGVKFYNDSISTICETTMNNVNSVKNVDTVILGGMDRGIDYQPLTDFLIESGIRNIILMPDTGYRIQKLLLASGTKCADQNLFVVSGIEEAVQVAKRETRKGMTCLFSPAAASYGFFKNFEERGEVFKKLVLSK